MWSVPSRRSEPSTAARTLAGLLSAVPGPPPACETSPNLVATTTWSRRPCDRPPDELLAVERAVDLGGVDVGDAQVERAVDGADGLGVVQAAAGGVGAGHGHGAEADPGDRQVPECACFNGGLPACTWCGDVVGEIAISPTPRQRRFGTPGQSLRRGVLTGTPKQQKSHGPRSERRHAWVGRTRPKDHDSDAEKIRWPVVVAALAV